MKYELIVFDLDGTLLDTLKDLTNSVNATMRHLNLPERTMEEVRSFIGNGVRVLLQRSIARPVTEKELDDAYQIFSTYYAKHLYDNTCPYPEIISLLERLDSYLVAVVSNKTDAAVKKLNEKFFHSLIPIACGAPADKKKPDPSTLLELMKHYQIPKEKTLYVGDSDVDILTAHNANVKCVGVSWGFRGREFLEAHGADYIIDTPCELLDLL